MRKEFYGPSEEMECNPDLVAEATSFIKQMCSTDGSWKNAHQSASWPSWMAHYSVRPYSFPGPPTTFQLSFRFAHVLLQGGEHARYRVLPDEVQDAAIYEHIGLFGATSSRLAIAKVPALVDYKIDDYDGLESVNWRP